MLRSPRIWLGIALSALFIGIFLWRTDFGKIGDAFAHANYWWALASIPVYFVAAYFRAWRWKYLLRPLGEMRVSSLFPIVIIGFMANNLIPARAGEFVRAYIVGEREKVSKMAALGTIAVDRVFDGITLLPFLLIVGAVAGANFSDGLPLTVDCAPSPLDDGAVRRRPRSCSSCSPSPKDSAVGLWRWRCDSFRAGSSRRCRHWPSRS